MNWFWGLRGVEIGVDPFRGRVFFCLFHPGNCGFIQDTIRRIYTCRLRIGWWIFS